MPHADGETYAPKISIVVPVLQEEKLLPKTLAAFPRELRRKYNAELIVSDGGSTDGTLCLAEQHADLVVRHTEARRQTIGEGRNCGAKAARGETIVFINGDTVPINPETFLAFIARWTDDENLRGNVGALACPVFIAPDERRRSDTAFHHFYNGYIRLLVNIIGIGCGRGECQIVRSEFFRRVGGYNPGIAAGEDFDLFRRMSRFCRVRFEPSLPVFESPRRFRRYGYAKMLLSWTVNAFSVMWFGKSVAKEWEAVR